MLTKLAQYPTFQVFVAIALAFLLTSVLMPLFIRVLKYRNVGQQVRADGPQGHLVKEGTPTMGGIIILLVVGISFGLMTWFAAPDVAVASAKRLPNLRHR